LPFTVVPPPPDRELSDALNEFRDVHGNHFQIAKPDRASDVYTWWIISVTDAYDMIKAWVTFLYALTSHSKRRTP
jgi:hypothetical protein